jgi:hypothetical protein
MMSLPLLYPRPEALSDPFHDFDPDTLQEILQVPDSKMERWHYQQILGPFLPAGTYEEAAYFLPQAFAHILSHDDDALDLVTSLAWFISEYRPRLDEDGALEESRDLMRRCLEHWSKEFCVIHYDKSVCEAKGWGLQYFDFVKHSETLAEGTCDLVRFSTNADLAIQFHERISRDNADPIEAAWFLEFARQHFTSDVRTPPTHPTIRALIENKQIAERSAKLVTSELSSFADFPSYWRDTFNALGIDGHPTLESVEQEASSSNVG